VGRSIRAVTLDTEVQSQLETFLTEKSFISILQDKPVKPKYEEAKIPALDAFSLLPDDYPAMYAAMHQPAGARVPEGIKVAIKRVQRPEYAEAYYALHDVYAIKNKRSVAAARKAARARRLAKPRPVNFSRAVEALLVIGMNTVKERLESNAITAGSTLGHAGEAAL
jgi:hypothetical protein